MSPEEADVVKQIESERGDRLLALILYFVFAAGFFALGTCLMAIWGNDPALSSLAHYVIFALGAILVLIVTPILLRHGLRQRKLYRARFYQLITPLLTKKDYRSFTFLARPSVKSLSMPLRKVLSAPPTSIPIPSSKGKSKEPSSTPLAIAMSQRRKVTPRKPKAALLNLPCKPPSLLSW